MIARRHLKWIYYQALHVLGREGSLLSRLRKQSCFLVLNMHRVSPRDNAAR